MYVTKITVRNSTIDGKGVFTLEDITKGAIVWRFDPHRDQSLSPLEFEQLDARARAALSRVAYFSAQSHRWIYPSKEDPAQFTNHSETNNLSVVVDGSISEEPFFVANRDISAGEELTVNYTEFDARPGKVLEWE